MSADDLSRHWTICVCIVDLDEPAAQALFDRINTVAHEVDEVVFTSITQPDQDVRRIDLISDRVYGRHYGYFGGGARKRSPWWRHPIVWFLGGRP